MRFGFPIAVACIAVATGCVSHRMEYTPPKRDYVIQSNMRVNAPKDAVWKKLVAGLSSKFFVINNMDKESGFINLSYSGDPSKYIDCGEIYHYFKNARGEREYRFKASSPFARYEDAQGSVAFGAERKMALDGRINILLQQDGEGTVVSMTVKYIVTKEGTFYPYSNHPVQHNTEVISFNSGGSATYSKGTECVSSGALEKEILSLIQ